MMNKVRWWVLGLGCAVLALSLGRAFVTTGSEAARLQNEVLVLRADLGKLRQDLSRARDGLASMERRVNDSSAEVANADQALQSLIASDSRLAGNINSAIEVRRNHIGELRKQIEEVKTRNAARQEAEAARARAEASRRTPGSEKTGGEKDAKPSSKEVERELNECRGRIAVILSSAQQLGTGIVLFRRGGKCYILTLASVVARGSEVVVILRVGGTLSAEDFEVAMARVVDREERLGLVLLECTPKNAHESALMDIAGLEPPETRKGMSIFAVGAHAVGNTAFADSVFDGIVSSLDRSGDGLKLLLATLPPNPGSLGSAVLDAKGRFLGILWKAAGNLEGVSVVLPAEELIPILQRWQRSESTAGRGLAKFQFGNDDAVILPGPLDGSTEVFPGPDDIVVLWNTATGSVAAYRPGKSKLLWKMNYEPYLRPLYSSPGVRSPPAVQRIHTSPLFEPWGAHAIITNRSTTVALSLKSGKPALKLGGYSPIFSQSWRAFSVSKNILLLALNPGMAFVNIKSRQQHRFETNFTLMAQNDNIYTFSTTEGNLGWLQKTEFLAIVKKVDYLLGEMDRLSNTKRPPPLGKIHRQIEQLNRQLPRGMKVFTMEDGVHLDALQPWKSFFHVPGTYVHIIGRTLWEIGPTDVVKRGQLESIRHSASREDWFRRGLRENAQPTAQASPDGRFAVTETHVFNLKTLKCVAELPFPSGPAGFTSSGMYIYAYDHMNHRLVFLPAAHLQE